MSIVTELPSLLTECWSDVSTGRMSGSQLLMLGSVSALQETLSTCGDTELTLTLAGGAGAPVKESTAMISQS